MEFKAQKDILESKTLQVRFLGKLCLVLGATSLISVMTNIYTIRHHQVVVVPMGLNQAVTVTSAGVDAAMLEQTAMSLINARYNVNYTDVDSLHQFLLQYTDNAFAASLSPILMSEEQDIKNQQLTSLFVVQDVKADPSALAIEVTGNLQEWSNMVGNSNTNLPDQSKVIDLKFSYTGGILKLIGWGEKNAN